MGPLGSLLTCFLSKWLRFIENNGGEASKWDLIKIAGNEAAFRRWVPNFFLKHKFVEKSQKGRIMLFRKTAKGELLHKTLRDRQHFVVAFKRLSGKRLKSEFQI